MSAAPPSWNPQHTWTQARIASLFYVYSYGDRAVFWSVADRALAHGFPVNAEVQQNTVLGTVVSLLYAAVREGDAERVRGLLAAGAAVTRRHMLEAVTRGAPEAVLELLGVRDAVEADPDVGAEFLVAVGRQWFPFSEEAERRRVFAWLLRLLPAVPTRLLDCGADAGSCLMPWARDMLACEAECRTLSSVALFAHE